MIIYTSEQAKPYVYMGIHTITGEIYIGYREANILPSHLDVYQYRTSSKVVNPNFDDYDWCIVAEFFAGQHAYDYEQQLIYEHWHSPLLVNRSCYYGKQRFKSYKGIHLGFARIQSYEEKMKRSLTMKGRSNGPQSQETIDKRVKKLTGQKRSDEAKANISASLTGKPSWHKGRKKSAETIQRMHEGNKNRKPVTEEARRNMSVAHSGVTQSQETINKRVNSIMNKPVEMLAESNRKRAESLRKYWADRKNSSKHNNTSNTKSDK